MKFIKKTVLVLGICVMNLLNIGTSHGSNKEEALLNFDTGRYLSFIATTQNFLASDNGLTKDDQAKLRSLLVKMDKLVGQIKNYQDSHKSTVKIKDEIRTNLRNRNTYFSVDINRYASNQEISDLFLQVAKEDEYFYYSEYGACKISTTYKSDVAGSNKKFIEKANFDVNYRASLDDEYRVRDFVDDWIRENIRPDMSDYNKVLAIHDFIVKKNFYNTGDRSNMSGGYSIYHPSSILYGRGGVCNAYASLFNLLAQKAGLKTYFLTGKSTKNGEDHMWNMVQVAGSWYHIDTTWDDPVVNFSGGDIENIGDFVIYDYFLKSDEQIKKSRSIDQNKYRPIAEESYSQVPNNSKIELVDGKYWIINQ